MRIEFFFEIMNKLMEEFNKPAELRLEIKKMLDISFINQTKR